MERTELEDVLKANKEMTGILAQWQGVQSRIGANAPANYEISADVLFNPALFWGYATGVGTREGNTSDRAEAVASGLKMQVAKLKAGDLSYVHESIVGQAMWLSKLSIELMADANKLPANSNQRNKTLELALRAQGLAGKLLLSVGALANASNSPSKFNDSDRVVE